MAPVERTKHLHLMLSGDEVNRLQSLADRNELKQSDYIRQLLKREWEKEEGRYNDGPGKQLKKRPKK